MLRRTPLLRRSRLLRRTRLRPVSRRRARELREYYSQREKFLARPENFWCPVAWQVWGMKIRTVEIHHKRGRIGAMLNNERYWLAVSQEGHAHIHAYPSQSRARGWMG